MNTHISNMLFYIEMKNIHMKAQHINCYRNVTDITLLCAMISAYFDYHSINTAFIDCQRTHLTIFTLA